jgi:hypothetical protein
MATLLVPLHTLPLGTVVEKPFELVPVKGVKKGGILNAKFQVTTSRAAPFLEWRPPRPPSGPLVLNLRIVSADAIEKTDTVGKTDPFIKIKAPGGEAKTTVKPNTLTPTWDEVFRIPIPNASDNLVNLKLFDEDVVSDDEISYVNLQTALYPVGEVWDLWVEFTGVRKVKRPGRVRVILQVALQSATPFVI